MRWMTGPAKLGFGLVGVVLLAGAPTRPAAAQTPAGVLRGVVVDSASGSLLEGADILIASLHQVARSNEHGVFTLIRLPAGRLELTVRRLGYLPQQQTIILSGGANDSVKVVMVAQPEVLEAIQVDAAERHRRQGIEGFYVRRAQGI